MIVDHKQDGLCGKKIHPVLSTKYNSPWNQSQQYIVDECQTCSRKQRRQCKSRFIPMVKRGDIKKVKRVVITPKPVKIEGQLINASGRGQTGFRMIKEEGKVQKIQRIEYPRIA